jgi:hypothetical protein
MGRQRQHLEQAVAKATEGPSARFEIRIMVAGRDRRRRRDETNERHQIGMFRGGRQCGTGAQLPVDGGYLST